MITSGTIVTSCVDWLSVTRESNQYPENYPKDKKELKRGMQGYDTAVQFIDGRVELCSSSRRDMGVHTILSGKTIKRLCELAQINSFDIVDSIGRSGCSRIDLAVDIKHGNLDIGKLWQMLESDLVDTSKANWLYLRGAKGNGETLYIGSPKSEKRLRVYDKKAESGADHEWTRVEMQYRRKSAKSAVQTLLMTAPYHECVPGMVNSYINFENDRGWSLVMGEALVKMGGIEKGNSDRQGWLLDTATSALAAEMVEGSVGKDFLETFISATLVKFSAKLGEYKK